VRFVRPLVGAGDGRFDAPQGQAGRGQFAGQEVGLGSHLGRHLAIEVVLAAVALGLAVLRQQDQRGGVGGLRREREVEQDERVRSQRSVAQIALTPIQTITRTVWMTR